MTFLKLFKGKEFTEEEYAIVEFLCKAYLAFDPKIASFLMSVMVKKPEETNFQFSIDGLTLKWIDFGDNATIGAFNPLWPTTLFIGEQPNKLDLTGDTPPPYKNKTKKDIRRMELQITMGWILEQFPFIMHELYHMLQFKASKVGYVFMRLITVVTELPYYLFQEASWMPYYKKIFSWDLEGQAEANGDKAPNIEMFVTYMNLGYSAYEYNRSALESYSKRLGKGIDPKEDGGKSLEDIEEEFDHSLLLASQFGSSWGKKLYDLIENLSSKYE